MEKINKKKKVFKDKLFHVVEKYKKFNKTPFEIMNILNDIKNIFEIYKPKYNLSFLFNEIIADVVGFITEIESQKEKIMQNSTIKVISEYMLSYLNDIEREIINSSTSKLKLHEKIRRMINEYLNANYFKKILIVTVVDDIIESVYGDEYTLSKYIYDQLKEIVTNKNELEKFMMIYQGVIDGSDISDFKICFRKALIEKNYSNDLLCDMWVKLNSLVGDENSLKIRNSLSLFKSKKIAYNEEIVNPIIYALKDSKDNITDEFKRIEINGKVYYGASIYTLEDDLTKFERFISKLKSCGYNEEASILNGYLINNIALLTDKAVTEKFSHLNPELFEEIVLLNKNKYSKTCIGHIILGNPTDNIFNSDGSLNFIVSMVMKSIYKMGEVLLTNDFEFQEFQKEMVVTLQQMAKLRDIETANHQDRVTIYTKILADALRKKKEDGELDKLIIKNNIFTDTDYYIIDKEYIRDLVYSASLHDLGKVGIDDDILKSSKKLTEEEYEIMKNHTIYGQQRLTSIVRMSRKKSFLVLAAALAENHHEKWDGTGYPNGKKGFEIPLSARILAIADVYDALRRERSYKESFSHEDAMSIIINDKGKHFDPVLVDIFVENNTSFNEAFMIHKNNK